MAASLDRFFNKVQFEPNTGCWLWDGCINQSGYGRLYAARPIAA